MKLLDPIVRPINLRRDVRKIVVDMFSYLKHGDIVYDIGCGNKPFETIINDLGCRYVGVDLENGFYSKDNADIIGSAYDVPIEDKSVDAILSIQVLEHLENPRRAFQEAHRILKDDGLMIVSCPFLYPIHASPHDYFRYTQFSLRSISDEFGFEIIDQKEISGFWYVSGMNIGIYLQTLDKGIIGKIGFARIIISISQWLCKCFDYLESKIITIFDRNPLNHKQAWVVNYVMALKKR